jgi:hypothetical protein
VELIGLDAGFSPVKALRCLNIQWNRRYYEAGDYALQLRAADWDDTIAYVYAPDRPETGMVEKVEAGRTLKGDFVEVGGFFLEGMLNWKAVYPRLQAAGNAAGLCRALAAAHLTDAGVTVADGAPLGGDTAVDLLGDPLGDATYAMLKAQALSQRIRLHYETEALLYEVWQGLDRTQSQSENPYAVFSRSMGTADELTLTRDDSAWRNYAVAAYEGGVLEADLRTDAAQPKRVLYLDTGLGREDGQTEEAFLSAVRTAAETALGERTRILNVEATALQRNLLYRTDYDLGDLCDVRDDRLSAAFEARIIEADEVWKNNEHTVSLQFGDKIPVAYRR